MSIDVNANKPTFSAPRTEKEVCCCSQTINISRLTGRRQAPKPPKPGQACGFAIPERWL